MFFNRWSRIRTSHPPPAQSFSSHLSINGSILGNVTLTPVRPASGHQSTLFVYCWECLPQHKDAVRHQVSLRQERKKGMSGVTPHTLLRSLTASNIWPIDGIKGYHIDDNCCWGSSKTSRKKLCNIGNYYSILISKLHVHRYLIFPETIWSRLPLYIALLCFWMFLSCFFLLIYPLFGYWKAPQLVIMLNTFLYQKK